MKTVIMLVAGSLLAGVAAIGAWVYLRPEPAPELNRETTDRFGPDRRYAPYLMLVPAQPKTGSKGSSSSDRRGRP